MKELLLFGAGKSATVLIDYLLGLAVSEKWRLILVDADYELAKAKLGDSLHGEARSFDITQPDKRSAAVLHADLVISMLPPALHRLVASSCLEHSRHLLTASYIDESMRSMEQEISKKGILFLCEMGLDPGIDHMSAMQLIHGIQGRGGHISSFTSHCGGLIAPESDNNPWHYKISWNPRNIVMAGNSGAVYKRNNEIFTIPYSGLFEADNRVIVPGHGDFAWYANRDSLSYIPLYGMEETADFLRTTLRHPDFMKGWNYVVKLGLTSEEPFTPGGLPLTYKDWMNHQARTHTGESNFENFMENKVDKQFLTLVSNLFNWLGFTSKELLPTSAKNPADVLQSVLESKLQLMPGDKDMIVMLHEFSYAIGRSQHEIRSSLVVKGDDTRHTAMAKTVGLPLGIAARLLLNGTITRRGLCIPVYPDLYQPVLGELATLGISFVEEHRSFGL
ncbi:MAG: saccharopine dehydrogenase C-terminal domain-containing protein [Chitinophagaceae bacterium]